MALDLSTLSAQQQAAAIYIGYYDRAPDPEGSNFWIGAVTNPNLSLADIATDFSTQAETQAVHPFFTNPTAEEANAFITSLYLNLFNREPDADGLAFWSAALQSAIAGDPGALDVGEIILAIIEGAQDVPGGTQDRTTILNKIEVATSWTDAAEAAGIDYASDAAAQGSAKSIIEGVTDDGATVVAAKATIDAFFEPAPVPGDTFLLTSATDAGPDFTGGDNDDQFLAYLQQNPFAGGVSNSLSSADRLDGGAGNDSLYAELSFELFGTSQLGVTDVQPRIKNIEKIEIEARDFNEGYDGEIPFDIDGEWSDDDLPLVVDAKNITDVEEIGSYYSDGDLIIENLTTLTSGGGVRNTDAITITMDHTDNSNSDHDSSDLKVYFDDDYLLSGQESTGQIFYWLLDEDAELAGLDDRLNNIDVDGLRFTITNADGSTTDVNLEAPEANVAGTHQGFVNALQPALQALIADGTLPAGTTLVLDPTIVDTTFLDDGSESAPIPAMVLTSGDGSEVVATGFSRIAEEIGEYDVYGRFDSENEVEDQPITINIDLHKVGRGGEGGELVIGGKADADGNSETFPGDFGDNTADGIADGIEVFKINVIGDETKPNVVDRITSTGEELAKVYIATDPVSAQGDTFASLEVENGFNEDGSDEDGDLQLINADAFLGDLRLGTDTAIANADTITAQGGGDIFLNLVLDGDEEGQAYSYTTGSGDDTILVDIDGDALDHAGSSLNIMTGAGDDEVRVETDFNSGNDFDTQEERLNQAILDNIEVETGAGQDSVVMEAGAMGNFNIDGGDDEDFIDTSGGEDRAAWAFNFDDFRDSDPSADDLPGVPTTLAYVGGATVVVTLSGAGDDSDDELDGGGVMAFDGAMDSENGYEARATVTVAGPNQHFGTQVDVNNAIIEAITNDPVLSKLITLTLTENNTWVATMTTGGDFQADDLKIQIIQRDQGDEANDWNGVEAEARSIFGNSGIVINDLDDANGDGTGVGFLKDLTNDFEVNDWYTGLSAADGEGPSRNNSVRIETGEASVIEQDNVINGGSNDAANDLIVLSTDEYNGNPEPTTDIPGNTLQNYASNETIVMEGNFGYDTIMNFTVMETGFNMTSAVQLTAYSGAGAGATESDFDVNAGTRDGLDFLDFTSYLTSQEDISDNTSPADSSDSNNLIAVTLDGDAVDVGANEVAVLDSGTSGAFDNAGPGFDAGETWSALSASVVERLFNNDGGYDGFGGDSFFGNLDAADFSVLEYDKTDQEELIGDAKAILMIENADNLGEYKVFELTWEGDENDDDDPVVSATQVGSLDFGTSLNGEFNQLHEINLVGSDAYGTLIDLGFHNSSGIMMVTPV